MPDNGGRPLIDPSTGYLVVRVAELIDRGFTARLQRVQLRPRELHALRYVDASDGISQRELADALGVDAANLIDTLDRLEDAGLMRREANPGDRRRRRVTLTAAGRRRLEAGLRAANAADADVLGVLGPDERTALHDMMLRVYTARSQRRSA
jgi:DNA-binding MarR family transcriptional regulator